MPEVVVARRLTIFLEDDLDRLFPRERWVRAVAHPTRLPAQIAPSAGDGKAKVAAPGVGASVGEGADKRSEDGEMGSGDADTMPVPGLRFSQVEPPKGEASMCVPIGGCNRNPRGRTLRSHGRVEGSGISCPSAAAAKVRCKTGVDVLFTGHIS